MRKNLFAPQTSDLLEKLALIFLHNFHRDQILLTMKIKKVITENQCEKHKKLEFNYLVCKVNIWELACDKKCGNSMTVPKDLSIDEMVGA